MEWIIEFATLCLELVFVPAVVGPVLIYLTFRQPMTVDLEPIHESDLPQEAAPFVFEAVCKLQAERFGIVAYARCSIPDAVAHFALLRSEQTPDLAMAVVIQPTLVMTIPSVQYVEFSRELSNGVDVCTNNSPQEGAYRAIPDRSETTFGHVRDPGQLYRLHRELLRQRFPGVSAKLLPSGGEVAAIRESMTKEMSRQIDCGYLRLDALSRSYRPTMKGACLMTWTRVWPVSSIRTGLRRREGKLIEKQLAAT